MLNQFQEDALNFIQPDSILYHHRDIKFRVVEIFG